MDIDPNSSRDRNRKHNCEDSLNCDRNPNNAKSTLSVDYPLCFQPKPNLGLTIYLALTQTLTLTLTLREAQPAQTA